MIEQQETNIDKLADMLSELSVLDLSKLKKILEGKWDVKASMGTPMIMAPQTSGEEGGSAQEEATDFKIVLEEVPSDKKISVIKALRGLTILGIGLQEAKSWVEGAPSTIKESSPKAEAEEIKKKLVDAGAKISLTGV